MELKDLKSLIKLVTDTDITEFNMENQTEKIHIKRGPDKEIVHVSVPATPVAGVAPAISAPIAAPAAPTA
ncbi:MAG: acetyl-CoA carboxylase, biotin carboxyl carrier protein, partial [Thermodesulfobacteriota bacterium]|nr:acetyl-CoA carboxylase, biotin carboxyl carrier protein [Thermodesulfobacteriota bacterium]